jgi:hypothetical protein
MNKEEVCQKLLDRGFTYDCNTGEICNPKGRKLTYVDKSTGYFRMVLSYEKKKYKVTAHQFAFYTANKYIPKFIDHINRIRTDNKINNLRPVDSIMINSQNRIGEGYSFNKRENKYVSSITILGKKKHLGYFDTKEKAQEVYLLEKKLLLNDLYGC